MRFADFMPLALMSAFATRTETDWKAVLAAALCGLAVAVNVGKVPIAMTELRAEFGLSLVAAGWMSSMINAIGVSIAILFGVLGDRLGAQRLCYGGLAISLCGGIAGLLAPNESTLLVSRFLEGAGMVSVAVSAPALLSSAAAPTDRRFALGIWSGYLPAGVGLVMLLAPLVMPLGGWRGLWITSLLILTVALLAVHALRQAYRMPLRNVTDSHPLIAAKDALAQPAPWLLAFAMGSWTVQHYALIIWLPTFLNEQRDIGLLAASLLTCMMVLANVPGNLIGGSLLQRNFRCGDLIAGASLLTGLASVGIFLDGLPDLLRYALCVLLSFVGGVIPASVLSSSANYARTPRQIGTLQGLYIQVGNFGPFFGVPAIAAVVAASGQWRDALWITGGAALFGVTMGLAIRRYESR